MVDYKTGFAEDAFQPNHRIRMETEAKANRVFGAFLGKIAAHKDCLADEFLHCLLAQW